MLSADHSKHFSVLRDLGLILKHILQRNYVSCIRLLNPVIMSFYYKIRVMYLLFLFAKLETAFPIV